MLVALGIWLERQVCRRSEGNLKFKNPLNLSCNISVIFMTLRVATDVPSTHFDMMEKVKGHLFFKKGAGFLGSLMANVKFVWTRDVEGMGISPTHIYWNPDVFSKEDFQTSVTSLAHELWHNALMHSFRRGNRCPEIWNIAADHVINLLLKAHGFYMGGFAWIMDDKYIGWSTEDVYDDLIRGGMKPNSTPGNSCSPAGKDIIESEGTPEEFAMAVQNVIQAQTVSKLTDKPGVIPGEVAILIQNFLHPVLPWHRMMARYFEAMIEELYSLARPNRRFDDPFRPSLMGREGLENPILAADISGSITDEQILRFFSEGKHLFEEFRPEAMTFVTFDTAVHDVFRLERDDPYDTFEITGRGGTDLNDLYRFCEEEEDRSVVVIFTDLCVDIPPKPNFDIIWVVFGNPSAEVPYGTLLHFNDNGTVTQG